MPIQTQCPNCETSYTLADALLGKSVACKSCSNPFTVQHGVGHAGQALPPGPSIWRTGKQVMFNIDVPFPDICLKSNQATTNRLEHSVTWRALDLYFVYFDKTATIQLPISEESLAVRKKARRTAALLLAAGVMLAGIGSTFFQLFGSRRSFSGVNEISSVISLLGAAIFAYGILYARRHGRSFKVSHYMDEWFYLRGAGDDYLGSLQELPASER